MFNSLVQGSSLEVMVQNAEAVERDLIEAVRKLKDHEQTALLLYVYKEYGNTNRKDSNHGKEGKN